MDPVLWRKAGADLLLRVANIAPLGYLQASLAGWRVVRLGPNEITTEHVGRLITLVCEKIDN
jgi:hypothetical protein